MKTVKMTTKSILESYNVIGACKYDKMDSDDKIKVWKITSAIKAIAEKYDEAAKDCAERMKKEGFDDRRDKANVFERMTRSAGFDASKLPIGPAEYMAVLAEIRQYGKEVDAALKALSEKEETIKFEPISEDGLKKLMDSNPDFNMAQLAALGWIVEKKE
jgi:hypothetical protein